MRQTIAYLSIIILALSSTAVFSQSSQSEADLKEVIETRYQELGQHMQEGDTEGLAENLYTKDAIFYPPMGGEAVGRKEIAEFFDGMLAEGIIVQLQPQEVERIGDMIYEYGIADVSNVNGDELGFQRYAVLWKKDKEDWKMYRDFVKPIEQ